MDREAGWYRSDYRRCLVSYDITHSWLRPERCPGGPDWKAREGTRPARGWVRRRIVPGDQQLAGDEIFGYPYLDVG
jgi:hypothetical protein